MISMRKRPQCLLHPQPLLETASCLQSCFLSPCQLCATHGDNLLASASTHHLFPSPGEQTALSIIAILPLGIIFQTLKGNFVPHHSSCPSHLMMRLDGCWSFLLDLAPRRTWVSAHLCEEGMVQKPPLREGKGNIYQL